MKSNIDFSYVLPVEERKNTECGSSNLKLLVLLFILSAIAFLYFSSTEEKIVHSVSSAITQSIKTAVDNGTIKKGNKELLKLQLALVAYIAENGSPPDKLLTLVPKYIETIPINPNTGKTYQYMRKGGKYNLGGTVSGIRPAEKTHLNLKLISEEQSTFFTYSPEGLRDPFKTLNFKISDENLKDLTPLERFSLGQLQLVAIVDNPTNGERVAVVEDASGIGYSVRKGTKIGNKKGVVTEILPSSMSIVEMEKDFTGKESRVLTEMKLSKNK